jgi:prepilin-type N-terminal cleavage/methylation domain-containing protein
VKIMLNAPASSASPRPLGFTLVELLVVVAIIAVLISLLMPSLANAKKQAQSTACLSNLRQMAIGTNSYCADFQDAAPAWGFSTIGSGTPTGFNPVTDFWTVTLAPYVGASQFAWNGPTQAQSTLYQAMVKCYFCPLNDRVDMSNSWYEQYPWTYALSALSSCPDAYAVYQHQGKYGYLKSNKVSGSGFVLFVDCVPGDRCGYPWYAGGSSGYNDSYQMLAFRHGQTGTPSAKINVDFLDGHAETLKGPDYLATTPDRFTASQYGFWMAPSPASYPIGGAY